jgi:hypothetical protein
MKENKMAKQYTSSLTTDQLIQLAHEIFKPDSQDIRYVGSLMRAHIIGSTRDWNRQELIAFITDRNGGVPPDQIIKNAKERAANPRPTHAPPTSAPAPPPQRVYLVRVPCAACAVAVPEDKADSRVWCDQACMDKSNRLQNSAVNELTKFMGEVGTAFYDCQFNTDLMGGYLRDHTKAITKESLWEAFLALRGQLLTTLTPKQLNDMTADEQLAREKIDPGLGGCNLEEVRKFASQTRGRGVAMSHNSNVGFTGVGQ